MKRVICIVLVALCFLTGCSSIVKEARMRLEASTPTAEATALPTIEPTVEPSVKPTATATPVSTPVPSPTPTAMPLAVRPDEQRGLVWTDNSPYSDFSFRFPEDGDCYCKIYNSYYSTEWTDNTVDFLLRYRLNFEGEVVYSEKVISASYTFWGDRIELNFTEDKTGKLDLDKSVTLFKSECIMTGRDNFHSEFPFGPTDQPNTNWWWEFGTENNLNIRLNSDKDGICLGELKQGEIKTPIVALWNFSNERLILAKQNGEAFEPLLSGQIDNEWDWSMAAELKLILDPAPIIEELSGESTLTLSRSYMQAKLFVGLPLDSVKLEYYENGGQVVGLDKVFDLGNNFWSNVYAFIDEKTVSLVATAFDLAYSWGVDYITYYATYDRETGALLEHGGYPILNTELAKSYVASKDRYFAAACGFCAQKTAEDEFVYLLDTLGCVFWTSYHEGPGGDYCFKVYFPTVEDLLASIGN